MWLIRTKLEPPAPSDRLIARPRLRNRLPAILRAPLVLVHAPAGFGKTSALAEWRRCLRARNVRTAWISVDEDDAEPLQFLAYLTAALETSGVAVGQLGPAAARGFPDVPATSIVAALTQAIERSPGRMVVFIDDFHRLQTRRFARSHGRSARSPSTEIDRALLRLLRLPNARVSFVISGRGRPRIADQAQRLAGCVEIASDELRFSNEEAGRLLQAAALSAEQVDRLTAHTDGWPIALAMARQWLGDGLHVDEVLHALARPGRDLHGYIAAEILRSLAPAEREFLMRISVADRFCPPLAETLCPEQQVAGVLASLERKDLLVSLWDGGDRWLRCHRLLSDAALEVLQREDPALARSLHAQAAEWFFAAGLHAEAVRHAVASADADLLARLFERAGGWRLIALGAIGLARNALNCIPLEVLRRFTRSHLAYILMLCKQNCVAQARRELELLQARLSSSDVSEHDARIATDTRDSLHEDVAIINACLLRYEDACVDAAQCASFAQAVQRMPVDQHVQRATAKNILCAMYFEAGDLSAALSAGDESIQHYRAMHSLFGEVFVYVHQGCALLELGRLRDAEAVLRQAWLLARDTTGPDTETEAVAACMLAATLYERGEIDEAQRLLEPSLSAIEQGESWFELFANGYATATAIARRRGGWRATAAIIERARGVAASRGLIRLEELADWLELHHRVLDGQTEAADVLRLEATLRARLALPQAPRLRQRSQLVLARLALERQQHRTAAALLQEALEQSRAGQNRRVQIQAHALLALARRGLGELALAQREFETAIGLAMFEDGRQALCDIGPALLALIDDAALDGAEERQPRVRDRFLQRVVQDLHQQRDDADAESRLSERERAVLGLLAQGLSNKAIARALRVSDNTIKFHLKNIFAKLGVVSRSEAARIAGRAAGA